MGPTQKHFYARILKGALAALEEELEIGREWSIELYNEILDNVFVREAKRIGSEPLNIEQVSDLLEEELLRHLTRQELGQAS